MATLDKIRLAPSIRFTETDLTFSQPVLGLTSLGISGELLKGRAFEPTLVRSYGEFKNIFGGLNPCSYKGSQQPKYEAAYIAKEFLSEANELYVTRVLGLSGYDAGDSWSITLGANVDPETVVETGMSGFTATVRYNNDTVESVQFSDGTLQTLYDAGLIPDSVFGSADSVTGATVTMPATMIGDCDTFIGAKFEGTLLNVNENFICLTGQTISGQSVGISGLTQTCTVAFDDATVTSGSVFIINVTNPIAIIDKISNDITTVNSGLLRIIGGTITHANDDSLTVIGGEIYLPNGSTIIGGIYNICTFADNIAYYDCNNVFGTGFTITSGTSVIINPTYVTGAATITTYIPTGVETHFFSGTTTYLSGMPYEFYHNRVAITLRSNAVYGGNDDLQPFVRGIAGIQIEPVGTDNLIRPYDDFILVVTTVDGQQIRYVVSLNPIKANYIRKVLGTYVLCCENPSPIYVEESYANMLVNNFNAGNFYCIQQNICYNQKLNNYLTEYKTPQTPYVVSEIRGGKVLRLFRFYTLSDGEDANKEVKISIQNIRPDKREFDIVVRAFNDTDARPIVLEQFPKVSIDENSNNYIAKRIGTYDGSYKRNSNYIAVEMATECVNDAFPAGFEGYPLREYGCKAPLIQYKTSYAPTERVSKVYLGLSDVSGYDQDMFDYKGKPFYDTEYWTGTTKGFHLDINASSVMVDGTGALFEFEVGAAEFKSEAGVLGTVYEKPVARKFTFAFYGGFDGWDIYRTSRTNTDAYSANGNRGVVGVDSGLFKSYILPDGTVGINSDYYAYLQGIRTFANKLDVRINLLATPGIDTLNNSKLVEETIIMVEEERGDTFYIITTPDTDDSGLPFTPQGIASAIEGSFDTSFAATYYPWGQYQDTENSKVLWLPPTAAVVKAIAITDKTRRIWIAPAGQTRGATKFLQARVRMTQSDMDIIYEGRINPMMTHNYLSNNSTVFIYGNSTLQDGDSALSDINVRRLIIYIQQVMTDIGYRLLFEPNDIELRNEFRRRVDPILASIVDERGLQRFAMQLDSSPEALASRELTGTLFVQPTRSLEQIRINFVLTDSQATFDNI